MSDSGDNGDDDNNFVDDEEIVEAHGTSDESDYSDTDDEQQESSSDSEDDDYGEDARGVWMRIMGEDAGPDPIPFTAVPGIKHPPPQDSKPIDYFNLFFTPDIIDKVVTETNTYAQQWIDDHRDYLQEKHRSIVHYWIKKGGTTAEELRVFIGLCLNMGIVRKTTLSGYWDMVHKCQVTPWFAEHFTRDRFQLLLKFLHFSNNAELPPPDSPDYKLYKIKPIVDHFNRVHLCHYHPTMDISIDESMVAFKGKTPHLRQFMPQKRHARFGVKLWCVCDSLNGYTSFFEVYKGKDAAAPVDPHGSTYALVMRLLTACNYLHRGHHLGIDNYFSSPDLFFDLFEQGTTATGTVRSNRKGLPREAINQTLRNNQTAERCKGNLLCVAYKDGSRKPILLSTAVAGGFGAHVNRHGQQVQKPKLVLKYNQSMGGVDLSDARLYKYLNERRTMKWTNKVVFSIFGRAVLNCFILYDQHTTDQPKLGRQQFMLELVESLAGDYYPPRVPRVRRSRDQIQRDRENPNLQVAAAPEPQAGPAGVPEGSHELRKLAKGKRRDCVAGHARRTRSSYECPACNVGLCPQCFANYHKK